MGQLISKNSKKNINITIKKEYLKANYSIKDLKNMLSSFGNLEKYLPINAK